MPSLSVALIVKDETTVLGHCLASVRDLADQIVVVDTGSSDGTPELAQALGAEVHHFTWCDDFARARNASLAHCRGDWVLILDADEAVDVRDHRCIREAIEAPDTEAYRLIIRNYYRSGAQSLFGQPVVPNPGGYTEGAGLPYIADFRGLRLARRHPDLAFQGRLHELLDPWFEARGLPIQSLEAVIHHYGKTFEDREMHKRAWYLELARAEARAHPDELQSQFNWMQQAMTAGVWDETLRAAQACLAQKPLKPALMAAALALQELGRPAEALPYLDTLLAHDPAHSLARNRRALSLALLGRVDEARRAWDRLRREEPTFALAHLNAAEFEWMGGNLERARTILEEGLEVCPVELDLWNRRIQMAVRHEGLEASARWARRALERFPSGGAGLWHRLVALQAATEGRLDEALRWIDEGRGHFPEDPELLGLRQRLGGEGGPRG